ncbi:hypothetical protein GBAR_LOCUS25782 [Geodia barretti]|uniref:Uncharacterized protein n=1 Tax=Geodia barretti TaxID=519541 RepID=A0AA35X719_GEOBA|nr:hypothetical protein GBAR_LOCUS25782 [Geodia barretti]
MCDSTNSRPLPLLQWFSPDGNFLVYGSALVISNITRDMAGTYTCVANQFTLTMNSSVEIIVHFPCDVLKSTDIIIVNMSSTAVGSTATYQCRDGPTDVYTTQCTSTGVWDPHPLSTLDCSKETESLFERYSKWLPWGAGAVGLLLLCCITTCAVITAVCVCKRSRRKGKQYLLRENSDQQQQMAVKNSQYLPVVKKTSEGTTATTTLNGWSFVIESQLTTPAEPNGKPSEPQPTTTPPIPLGQYSMITTIPEPTSEPPEVPQETRKPNGQQQYSIVPEHTTGLIGAYCVVQTVEENPTPEPSRTVAQKPPQGNQQKGLLYVEVSLNTEGGGFGLVADRVEYAALDLNAMASQQPPPPQTPPPTHDLDSKVSLDQILIQLREVTPHWRRLGEAVGVQRLDEISEYVGSESEAMVEVVDGWLANLHPNKPTWREIADVVDSIGHHDLAHSLRQVYVSGIPANYDSFTI